MNKILEKAEDIFIISFAISLIIFVTIFAINITEDYEEQECVKFYIKNKYITKSCEIYREKLEEIND